MFRKEMKKVAIVTGGSRGIGRAIAASLAREDYQVVINYNKSEKKALELQNEILREGYEASIFKADVSKAEEVEAMFDFCMEKYKNVDLLVNNAGISVDGLLSDTSEEEWDRVMNVNLKSAFLCSKYALKIMTPNHSGKIINISSMWGLVGASYEVVYSTSKAAIIGMTKALAKEMGPSNITVNAIAPGVVITDMMSEYTYEEIQDLKNETPMMKVGYPEDIANAVTFLASDKADFITGQVLSVNGGFVI